MYICVINLGEPPVDEVEIMRGQVKLLHNQLLFERHKCDLHAIRNRRLIGKTFKAVQHQEELLATVSVLSVQTPRIVHTPRLQSTFLPIPRLSRN